MYGRVEVKPNTLLTSALGRGEDSGLCSSHFIPAERACTTHWIGGWLEPRASLLLSHELDARAACQLNETTLDEIYHFLMHFLISVASG
jgi:hypothetical protein